MWSLLGIFRRAGLSQIVVVNTLCCAIAICWAVAFPSIWRHRHAFVVLWRDLGRLIEWALRWSNCSS